MEITTALRNRASLYQSRTTRMLINLIASCWEPFKLRLKLAGIGAWEWGQATGWHRIPPPALGMSGRVPAGDHRGPLPACSCLRPWRRLQLGLRILKGGATVVMVVVVMCVSPGSKQGGETWGSSFHPPHSTPTAWLKYKHSCDP